MILSNFFGGISFDPKGRGKGRLEKVTSAIWGMVPSCLWYSLDFDLVWTFLLWVVFITHMLMHTPLHTCKKETEIVIWSHDFQVGHDFSHFFVCKGLCINVCVVSFFLLFWSVYVYGLFFDCVGVWSRQGLLEASKEQRFWGLEDFIVPSTLLPFYPFLGECYGNRRFLQG